MLVIRSVPPCPRCTPWCWLRRSISDVQALSSRLRQVAPRWTSSPTPPHYPIPFATRGVLHSGAILFEAIDAPIGGYTITDVMFLWAVAAAGFGLGAMVCGNSAYLSRIIYQGDLDVYLTQPKPVLPNLLASRMSVSSWGDLLYGLGLFAVSQPLTPASIGLFLLFVLLAAGVLVAVRVLYHSLTFLLGNAEDLAGLGSEQIITFSLYPGTIFDAPVVAVILHTLIPAALVAHLPADLFRAVARGTGLDWRLLAVVIGGDAALIAAACAVFALGLRRYESGNRIGARI